MHRCVLLATGISLWFLSPVFANPDGTIFRSGDLRISEPGSGLVFPDGSVQNTATVKGPTGPQGPTGAQGPTGDQGPIGPQGPANNLSIGTVSTGAQAGASISGAAPNQILNLTIPNAVGAVSSQITFAEISVDGTNKTATTVDVDSFNSMFSGISTSSFTKFDTFLSSTLTFKSSYASPPFCMIYSDTWNEPGPDSFENLAYAHRCFVNAKTASTVTISCVIQSGSSIYNNKFSLFCTHK